MKAIHSPSGDHCGRETLSEPRVSWTVRSSVRLERKRFEMRVSFSLSPSPLTQTTKRASGDSAKSLMDSWKMMSSDFQGEVLLSADLGSSAKSRGAETRVAVRIHRETRRSWLGKASHLLTMILEQGKHSAIGAEWKWCRLGATHRSKDRPRRENAGRKIRLNRGCQMLSAKAVIGQELFRFFKDLGENNRTAWMQENRERYQASLVRPLRRLLEEVTPAVLRLNGDFDVSGRTGANFSRINRDIRFAKDKTPYKTTMYLTFEVPAKGGRETGQLYAGFSKDTVTAGFRIYMGGARKESTVALVAEPRVSAKPDWVAQQQKRLGRKYQSYWYTMKKGAWTKNHGWPVDRKEWKRLQAWIVRKKMRPSAAMRGAFVGELATRFKELYPLLEFTSLEK